MIIEIEDYETIYFKADGKLYKLYKPNIGLELTGGDEE